MKVNPERIINHLSLMEKNALLLLSGANAQPIHGKTAYQKEFLLLADNDENIKYVADFEPYLYGPHSEPAETAMETLISYGLAEERGGYFLLTDSGKEIASIIKSNPDGIDVDDIEDVKEFMNDMILDEIILVIYVLHPELTTESQIKDKIFRKRIPISIGLYKKSKVDIEMASYLAGVPIEVFLDKLRVDKSA